jgi:hypothetical protein
MSLLLSPATVLTSLAYPICLRGQVPPPRLRQHGVSTYESAFIDVRYTPVATNLLRNEWSRWVNRGNSAA